MPSSPAPSFLQWLIRWSEKWIIGTWEPPLFFLLLPRSWHSMLHCLWSWRLYIASMVSSHEWGLLHWLFIFTDYFYCFLLPWAVLSEFGKVEYTSSFIKCVEQCCSPLLILIIHFLCTFSNYVTSFLRWGDHLGASICLDHSHDFYCIIQYLLTQKQIPLNSAGLTSY